MSSEIEKIFYDIDKKLKLCTNIGIFVSGGFDSSVLGFTTLYLIKNHHHDVNIKFFTVPRHDDSKKHSERIVFWLCNLYENIDSNVYELGNPNLHHSNQVSSGVKECISKHKSITIFLGDTKNPSHLMNGPVRIKSVYNNIYQPFLDYDKTITLKIANHFNILNKISEISHTCTESKSLRCGTCWQCKERKWAFNELNFVDTGTM